MEGKIPLTVRVPPYVADWLQQRRDLKIGLPTCNSVAASVIQVVVDDDLDAHKGVPVGHD